jgi:choline kinase
MRLDILKDTDLNELYNLSEQGLMKVVVVRLQTKRMLCNTCPHNHDKIKKAINDEYEKRNNPISGSTNQVL